MSAEAAINRLLEIHPKGFDLSLDRIRALLEKLGNPQFSIPRAFHVAGTNGKGSTSAFLRAILEAQNRTVHVHTSPHLVNWNERYRLGRPGGGQFVSDAELEEAILVAEAANAGKPITVFEIMSAVGFMLFSRNPADYSIMEVGLGGRFDATNVLEDPAACIITPVALDHQAYLGETVAKIAFEKAGIIKKGAPVIVGEQEEEGLAVIIGRCEAMGSPVLVARQDFDYYEQAGRFVYQDEMGLLDLPLPRLIGSHQLGNAAMAIAACRKVLPDLSGEAVETAMLRVSWLGRFERLKENRLVQGLSTHSAVRPEIWPEIWIDGGHNPQAGQVIARELANLEDRFSMPLHLIVGMLTTKDPSGFFSAFEGLVAGVVTVPVNQSDSGFDPHLLAEIAASAGLRARVSDSVEDALEMITRDYGAQPCRILICGSLYLVGEVLEKNGTPPQ